jgi:hypothetical protein
VSSPEILPTDQDDVPRQEVPPLRSGRVFGRLFLLMALFLALWTTWLTVRLPSHHLVRSWDLAWSGFDVLLTALLVATGIALVRRSPWIRACALATAVLLVVDIWFDLTTAQPGEQLVQAALQAILIEGPLAAFCLYVAWRADRGLSRSDA